MIHKTIKKLLFAAVMVPLIALSTPIMAMDDADIEQIDIAEIEQVAAQAVKDLETDEREQLRNKNRILWSAPVAFAEKDFDAEVKKLHADIPFYGTIDLSKYYAQFTQAVAKAKSESTLFKGAMQGYQEIEQQVDTAFSSASGSLPSSNTLPQVDKALRDMKNIEPPGSSLYRYFSGNNLLGIGLYRSDLNELGFLAANLATEYLLFKDLLAAKEFKVKEAVATHRDTIIALLEKITTADQNNIAAVKKEAKEFFAKECKLFHYNPFKKEALIPIAKYMALQRVVAHLQDSNGGQWHNPDSSYGFVKDSSGQLVRSGVTPISLVSIAKLFITPLQEASVLAKDAVSNILRGLRFNDRLFSSIKLPSIFYKKGQPQMGLPAHWYTFFDGAVGEFLVVSLAVKFIDNFLQECFVTSIVNEPHILCELLNEHKKLTEIDQPTEAEFTQIKENDEQIEKEIKRLTGIDNVRFSRWIESKRDTFGQIIGTGSMIFIGSTVAVKLFTFTQHILRTKGVIS